jgi:parvulin-like peptidyl-prolyl isomerase
MRKVSVKHILVQHEYEAQDLTRSLKSGKVFEELAKKYSKCSSAADGGNLGLISSGRTVAEFEEAAFSLQVGETSGPVKTRFGYHLIKRTD